MIYTHLAAALLAAALAAGGTWKVEEWRFASKEKDRVQAQLSQERLAAAANLLKEKAVVTALNSGKVRESRLRSDLASSGVAIDRLRDTASSALLAASTNLNACIALGATQNELLVGMAKAGERIATEADAWASDAQTLMEARN